MSDETILSPVELATEITIAWLNNPNNRVAAEDVPTFLRTMHSTLAELATGAATATVEEPAKVEEFLPAVTVRRSLASKEHILSLIDGKPYKTLTRHLTGHGLTPDEYRKRYNLRSDYPMVSENYSEARRAMAKRIGLGRRPVAEQAAPAPVVATKAAPKSKATATVKASAKPKAAAKPKAPAPVEAAPETV